MSNDDNPWLMSGNGLMPGEDEDFVADIRAGLVESFKKCIHIATGRPADSYDSPADAGLALTLAQIGYWPPQPLDEPRSYRLPMPNGRYGTYCGDAGFRNWLSDHERHHDEQWRALAARIGLRYRNARVALHFAGINHTLRQVGAL